jgi:molecular chaperone GrpE
MSKPRNKEDLPETGVPNQTLEEEEAPEESAGAAVEEVSSEAASSTEAAEEAGTPPEAPVEKRIQEMEAQLAEAQDLYLRKTADFENFRKRMIREKQETSDYANQSLLLDIILIIDDFERAIKAAEPKAESGEENPEFSALYEGILMIEKRMVSQLENRWGLRRYDSEGEPFDPNRHEALMMEKSPGVQEPTVAEEFLKGYTLKERVIRCAKVKVSMPE